MKKNKLLLIGTIVLAMMMIGCPNETTPSTTNVTVVTDNTGDGGQTTPTTPTTIPSGGKITSLQVLIDSDDVQNGSVINLADYSEITDYKATINKSLTLQNGTDLKDAALTVTADGVVLDNIQKASVTTQSSMKISGSLLSSLSIASVNSSMSSANMIVSRGAAASRSSDKAPTVEVTDSTVAEDITLGIAGAYLSVDKLNADKATLNLDAANTKLSIADKLTNIKEIKTDQICQVILEDGTSDTIPTPNVSGEGELKQIDMKAAGTLKLLALTPMSGLTTVVKKGESIDFSNVIVLGTYQADDGVTVFKAGGLSYNLTETFSKLEKEFTVSIGDSPVYKNGETQTYDWSGLTAGEHSAKIDCDYEHKDSSYAAYTFNITVTEDAELPTPTLKSVEVYLGANVGTTYLAGDTLDLGTLLVMGVYEAGNISYKNILTDYTLSKQTGTVLTTADTAVTVSIPGEDVTGTINLTVKPAVFVTFQVAEGQTIVSRIEQGTKVTAPLNIARIGYTFDNWYDDEACTNEHDFSTAVSSNTTIYAKWYPNAPHIITYHHQNDTADATADFYEFNDVTLDLTPTKRGYSLAGWCEDEACSGSAITGWRMGQKTADVNLWAKWNANQYDIIYKDVNNAEFSADSTADLPKTHTYGTATALVSPSRTGYEFLGWHKQADCSDNSIDTLGATDYIDHIILYAKWNAIVYAIYYIDLSADNGTAPMVTDNCAKTHTYGTATPIGIPTKMGHTFSGWYQSADSDNTIDTIAAEYRQDITLYAKWTYGVDVSADGLSVLMADLTSDSNPHLIKITDTSPDLSKIKSALTSYPSITIDLDLSQCTEMTKIADNAFDGGTFGNNKICNLNSIVIPDGVTNIGKSAFNYCEGLTSVTIPAGVTTIQQSAFGSCINISSVYYKGSLEQWLNIDFGSSGVLYAQSSSGSGNGGLYINGVLITEVIIPGSITEIKRSVFEGNKKLTKLTIPASVTKIGGSSFYNCTNLTRVDYTGTLDQWCNIDFDNYGNPLNRGNVELYIDNTLVTDVTLPNTESIKPNIFYGYKYLKSVTIPSGVTSIGYNAFANSSIESVTIPATVTSFNRSFDGCSSLTEINYTGSISDWMHISFTIPENNPLYGGTNTNNQRILKINGSEVTSVTINDQTIPKYAFIGCKSLTSVEIGENVKTIGQEAFKNCGALAVVTISNSVSDLTIDTGVFYGDTSLTNITIPAGVKCIGESAFESSGLTGITINNGVESIGQKAFYNCYALTSINIPDSVQTVGQKIFGQSTFSTETALASVSLPYLGASPTDPRKFGYYFETPSHFAYGIKQDPNENIYYHISSSVKNVTVRGGDIPANAFYNCSNITNITISGSQTAIPTNAFYYCTSLTTVTIPDSVQTLGDSAFIGCENLEAITIPANVTSIGESCFGSCKKLETINIPASVNSMGDHVFSGCTGLTKINYLGDIAGWLGITFGGYIFYEYSKMLVPLCFNDVTADNIIVPDTITAINDYAFYRIDIKSINLGSGVTSIGKYAFAYSGLTEITIPENVATIGEYALDRAYYNKDNPALQSVTIERTGNVITCSGNGNIISSEAPIYVPDDLVDSYKKADGWKNNSNIIAVSQKPQP